MERMKNNKGITLIALIITIVVLLIIAGISISGGITGIEEANDNRTMTELEKVQHAITQRYSKFELTKDTSLIVGTKIDDLPTIPTPTGETKAPTWKVFQVTSGATVSTHPERKYYRLSKSDLENLGLTGNENGSSYIVNYYSGEIFDENKKQTSKGTVLYKTAIENEASELGDEYIKDGMQVWYDGINNTGSGHSNNTTIWKDLSGNGRDGIMTNVTLGSNYAEFSGVKNSWVNLGEINDFTNAITLEAMVSVPEGLNKEKDIICNQQLGGACLRLYSNKPEFVVYLQNIGYVVLQSNISVPINKICHIVGRYSGTDFKIYLNGVEQTDITIMNGNRNQISTVVFNNNTIINPLANTVMALGCNPYGNYSEINYFKGKIFDAKIYNRALSEDEIHHNYILDKARYGIEE